MIRELSETFKPHGLLLSAALLINTRITEGAYEVPMLSKYLDWVSLKPRYDFDDKTEENFNIKAAVGHWLMRGAAPEKLVLGMYTFGWFSTSKIDGRTMVFDEICGKAKYGWKVVHNRAGSYIHKNNQSIAFDDVENIRAKAKLICEMNLGGGVLWTLDYDDFRGSCGCGKYPLITALNQEIRGIGGTPVQNCA